MSTPESVSDFARRCMQLVDAMNDTTQLQVDRDDARDALTQLLKAQAHRAVRDYKLAQAADVER